MTRTLGLVVLVACLVHAQPGEPGLRAAALKTLQKATAYYRDKVASHGGYVYYYSLDLRERWGEGKADADTLFVQPPGTPTVGLAFLRAYEATGDRDALKAAVAAGEALVYGQLQSGGWTQTIHYGTARRVGKYRNGKGGNWNVSSLDDDQTQAALRFLMHLDKALAFKNEAIHEATLYGLTALLKAQFPNGGFPQVWTGPIAAQPVVKAKYPEGDWKTDGKIKNYWDYYTLNDNIPGTVAETLILAQRVYGDAKYKAALAKLGDFLILAQMPEPQPGWCQQYNYDMVPMWGRKFEPPAITGWESQDAMRTLLTIARATGDKKYLEPLPAALKFYQKNLLEDGRVARFYELTTSKPLYMDGAYRLTYDDSAAPAHYGWKQPAGFAQIEKEYAAVRTGMPPAKSGPVSAARVREIVQALDAEGRWISTYAGEHLVGQPKFAPGFKYVSSEVFARNVEMLSQYLAATK